MRILRILAATAATFVFAGGAFADNPPVPPGAAALGYTNKVIDEHPTAADIAPDNANKGNYKWFNGALWDAGRPSMNLYSTVDGALAISYDPTSDKGGCLIGTPRDLSKGALPLLDGSKGFYIEFDARLSDNDPNHWPALWAMPQEHSGGSGNPARDIYPGDPAGYERWMELDVDEGGMAKSGGAMCSVISWTGIWTQAGGYKPGTDTSNNWATGEAIDRTKVHTFGASYDPVKRQVTSWVDGKQKWQTPVNSSSVPEIAAKQHFYPILSTWRQDSGTHKPYSMYVSGVRAYEPPANMARAKAPVTDAGTNVAPDQNAAPDKTETLTANTDLGVLTCPKTCTPGKEFEIKLELKDLAKITRNFKCNKLPVHLLWSTKVKFGGYLGHFASAEVTQSGVLTLKGKFQLSGATAEAAYVQVMGYLTDDWSNDKDKAGEFLGPKMEIVK